MSVFELTWASVWLFAFLGGIAFKPINRQNNQIWLSSVEKNH